MKKDLFDYIFTDDIHEPYGARDFSVYLYGLIRMIKPEVMVELGTGHGTTSFLAAEAMKENNKGKVITVDNGTDHVNSDDLFIQLNGDIDRFNLRDNIELRRATLDFDLKQVADIPSVDIVFNDFNCNDLCLYTTFLYTLLRTGEESYLFMDGGADFPFFSHAETLVHCLNTGKIPKRMYELVDISSHALLESRVRNLSFYFDFVAKDNERDHQCTFVSIHMYSKSKIPNPIY